MDDEEYTPQYSKLRKLIFQKRNTIQHQNCWIEYIPQKCQSRATRSKKQFHSNLTSDEHVAKQELNKLQNDRIITIKPCDKGCWVIVLNFCDYHYLDSCLKHLRCSEEIIQHPGQFLAGHSRYAQKSRRTKWWKFYWRGWHLCS